MRCRVVDADGELLLIEAGAGLEKRNMLIKLS